jgi:hypothetical protein
MIVLDFAKTLIRLIAAHDWNVINAGKIRD